MTTLEKQHEIVKNHPYRLNHEEQYKKSFCKEMKKLCELFWDVTTESFFYHEVASNLWHIEEGYYDEREVNIKFSELIKAIELAIGTIHKYIETGKFEEYWTYYTGDNDNKDRNRWSQYVKVKDKWVRKIFQ
jgi:hypothetical protein